MTPGTCLYCGCTEDHACAGGCAWVTAAKDVCTACFGVLDFVRELVPILGAVAANPKAGIRLTTAKWELLPLEGQRALVMTCRALLEGLRDALLGDIAEEVVAAGVELNAISGFLHEHSVERIQDDETLSQVVIRLLEPHVGSRIVLPGAVQ